MDQQTQRLGRLAVGALLLLAVTATRAPGVMAQEETEQAFDGEWRYQVSCASCHGEAGEGISKFGPPLRGNALVVNSPPGPIIRVIQEGRFNRGKAYPEYAGMPAFKGIRAGEARALVEYMKTELQE